MNTPEPPAIPSVAVPTRPFWWSVQRELWENRSVTVAPLLVTAISLLASTIATFSLPGRIRALSAVDPAKRHEVVVKVFTLAPAPIMLATFLVGLFYALDALHGERRDRSILFWKSLPVSDLTTVLAKASVPLAVLPCIGILLGLLTQWVLLAVSTAVFLGSGSSPAILWTEFRVFREAVEMVYGMAAHVLWFAPIYGWLLLVSVWARRLPVLWAVLPPFVLVAVERLAFQTTWFSSFLKDRATGAMARAFVVTPPDHWQLTPGPFLSSPALWLGLLFTVACLAAAVRLRRHREPT